MTSRAFMPWMVETLRRSVDFEMVGARAAAVRTANIVWVRAERES